MGYSAYNDEAMRRAGAKRESQGDPVQLPYCEG